LFEGNERQAKNRVNIKGVMRDTFTREWGGGGRRRSITVLECSLASLARPAGSSLKTRNINEDVRLVTIAA
jgi:hypothetical protein